MEQAQICNHKNTMLKNDNIEYYFTISIIGTALFFALALAFDMLQIHIYRSDSAYYIDNYVGKFKSEGRWLNYLLFNITSHIPGRVAVLSNLLFLFLFVFLVSKRWTRMSSYSFLFSLLAIQSTPLMESLGWPATGIAGLPILFLAAVISPYINIYIFYILFGVLLFGTSSFYLLPLTHLYLFKSHKIGRNLKILSLRIFPAWALGFIVGFMFSLLMVYLIADQIGIQLQDWRRPSYAHSFQGLIANAINSFHWFQYSLSELFGSFWRIFLMAASLLILLFSANKQEYLPSAIIAFAIIGSHFIITIPAGIVTSFRTSLAAWIGVLVIFFFYPDIKKRQYLFLSPIILFIIISFYRANYDSLEYYSSITKTYHDELVRVTPLPPPLYRGVIFLSSSAEVFKINAFLINKLHLKREKLEPVNEDHHWIPIAREAGFDKVVLCGGRRFKENPDCKSLLEDYEPHQSTNLNHSGLYKIHGQKNGLLFYLDK